MFPNLRIRVDQPEIMDTQILDKNSMEKVLQFLSVTNRYFGGNQAVLSKFEKWSAKWKGDQSLEILDVGTGGGDLPIALVHWSRKKGIPIKITGIDLVSQVTELAKARTKAYSEIDIQQADVFEWIRFGKKFDYTIASLFLHHIPPQKNVEVLKGLDQLSRRGLIISDLLRSQGSYWSVKLLTMLLGNSVVRYDGPLSVRRAFQIKDLENLIEEAKLPYLKAQHEAWFRVSLSGEKQ